MSIRWDAVLARKVARELRAELAGSRLRAVRLDGSARDMALLFRDRCLSWRLHPQRGYPLLGDPLEPKDGDVRLRATLLDVSAPPDERIVTFTLSPGTSGQPLSLVVELMGNQWNAVVVEGGPESTVIRHVLWRRQGPRELLVGQPYRPPPADARLGVDGDLSPDEWIASLHDLPTAERQAALVRKLAWTSPINARALLAPPTDMDGEMHAGYALWRRLADADGPSEPVVLELPSGLQPYPYPLPGAPCHRVPSVLAGLAECAEADGSLASGVAAPAGPVAMGRLRASVRRARGRVTRLQAEHRALGDPAALRALGDLILARYPAIPPGASHARLDDFDGGTVEVELDPSKPANENASAYYREAAKAERAAETLPGLLQGATTELERLEDLLARAEDGRVGEAEIVAALGPAPTRPGPGASAGPPLPYRTFRSSGGLEIRVGRGARHNDELTFHHSSPGDVWLHARHSAGAHVVLRWPGPGNPPARDLHEAATLAALYSKARTSGSVPVDWTLRKYVRKPRKAPPGRVSIDREQTLFVEPDPSLPKRLGADLEVSDPSPS